MAKQPKDTEESVNKLKKILKVMLRTELLIFLKNYKCTILGDIGFTVADKKDEERYDFWVAEAKQKK